MRLAPPAAGFAWLALLALSSQVVGWLAISSSLPRLPAATTSLLLMIQPVGSLVLGALIFAEHPSTLQIVGVVLLLGAVLYATRERPPRTGAPPAGAPRTGAPPTGAPPTGAPPTGPGGLSGTGRARARAAAGPRRARPRR